MAVVSNEITEDDLIQIRPSWYARGPDQDVNIWSRIHPRFQSHDGCIVDLGCLGWNRDFDNIGSDNWAGYFFGKKRVIGVDPQETPNEHSELFKGFISDFSGKANLTSTGLGASMVPSDEGQYDVLTWEDFKSQYDIQSISILKINIEGAEWDLLDAFDDFSIDQICVSFHNFLPKFNNETFIQRTNTIVQKLINNGYQMIVLGIYGWKIFLTIES